MFLWVKNRIILLNKLTIGFNAHFIADHSCGEFGTDAEIKTFDSAAYLETGGMFFARRIFNLSPAFTIFELGSNFCSSSAALLTVALFQVCSYHPGHLFMRLHEAGNKITRSGIF